MRYSYSESRPANRRTSSLPFRKKKGREDAEGGFATPSVVKEHNYDHDVDALKLSAANVYYSIKKLSKLQKDIARKSKKEKSKYLETNKEDYNDYLKTVLEDLKSIKEIVFDEREDCIDNTGRNRRPGQCHACFQKDRDLMLLQAQKDSLQTEYDRIKKELVKEGRDKQDALARINRELTNERREKQDALTRLSALTSSKLRDNNPNLTDLSDANRPSKIGEMFSELYDNEWTDAYDELSQTKKEAAAIQHLNDLLMDAYGCCMRLLNPIRLFLDTKSTKFQIDSEFRQKVIGHIKRNATAVISELKKDLQSEILKRCRGFNQTPRVLEYINKSLEICWLMAVQDPPMYLYNVKTQQFNSAKFRDYQRRGFYTEYIVWPALALYENGPLLSKGVAQGSDIVVTSVNTIRQRDQQATRQKGVNQTSHPYPNASYDNHKKNRQSQSYENSLSTVV